MTIADNDPRLLDIAKAAIPFSEVLPPVEACADDDAGTAVAAAFPVVRVG